MPGSFLKRSFYFKESLRMSKEEIKKILTTPHFFEYQNLHELKQALETEKQLFQNVLTQSAFSEELPPHLPNDIKVRFSGKKSPLQEGLKALRNLKPQERKEAGACLNVFKQYIENEWAFFAKSWLQSAESARLSQEKIDHTLPLPESAMGSRHPVSIVLRDLLLPFQKMGFAIIDGPEVDHDFYNFESLNVSKDHPAREMQDTFFLASQWVLRTHTSNVQSHAMTERSLPLKIVCPGCVYRNEYDLTHLPSFRQIECLVVDTGIHFGHLKHMINELLNAAFGRPVPLRFRSSYFPFTEPSAEVDVQCQQCFGTGCRSCKHLGWSEIGGCGVVNKKVLENCKIDSSLYSGIAFGFGADRIAKDRFAIDDLRSLVDGNVSFLKSFSLS
jgi:phenylalanyl-tRNA synthetase alpha chain